MTQKRPIFKLLSAPDGERITFKDGQPQVPNHPIIPFIEGDGIGPEITTAALSILETAVVKAYGNERQIQWMEVFAGQKAEEIYGQALPEDTLDALQYYGIGIKGPLGTPVGTGNRSYNVTLRQTLDLYSCVRPVHYIKGLPSPLKDPERVRMVIFRENTEDVYSGIEFKATEKLTQKLIQSINSLMKEDEQLKHLPPIDMSCGIGIKPMSEQASRRHMRRALNYALEHGYKDVTIVHKGNIMKCTEGAFLKWCYQLADEEFKKHIITEEALRRKHGGELPEGKILVKDRIADNMFQQTKLCPERYGILVTPNLNGDYLSDDLAALVGGLGIAPGGNIGDSAAIFEATHGTAPDIAGKDMGNPCSLLLSGAMMLEYMGWEEAQMIVEEAVFRVIGAKIVTVDFKNIPNATVVGTKDFAEFVIRAISGEDFKNRPSCLPIAA